VNKQKNKFGRALRGLFRGIDLARRFALNALFVLILLGLLVMLARDSGPEVPKKAALVFNPTGNVVEQLSGTSFSRALDKALDRDQPQALMADLLDALAAAKDDDRIEVLYLHLEGLGGVGPSKLGELGAAIEDFKTSGKKVIAAADNYSSGQYYLASLADEVHLHHMGSVVLEGFGRYRTYFKQGIDRLEVDWNVFKVGEYKSAVEPYLRDSMSDEAREANLDWMGDLWRSYLVDVAEHRGVSVESLRTGVEQLNQLLNDSQGHLAQMAQKAGLVDQVGSRDQIRARMIELVGEDEDSHSFHQISLDTYLEAIGDDRPRRFGGKKGDTVAVIVAKGTILDGNHPPGTIGGDSTARLIRQARLDDDVKALVLRVDSGGGSAFASEVIRREFVLAREAGLPVVVSMGTVAASGGYWISTASDEIWAAPNTITGSIGIFGMFPTYQKPLERHAGMKVDGIGTNWLAGAFRPDRELDPRVGELIQAVIDKGYREFLIRVAEARGMTVEEVNKIARGRVWSGEDAHRLGLVDQLGGLSDAIASAAEKAGLGEEYQVDFREKQLSFKDRLLGDMMARAVAWAGPEVQQLRPSSSLRRMVGYLEREAELLEAFDDPNGVYAHCMCEID